MPTRPIINLSQPIDIVEKTTIADMMAGGLLRRGFDGHGPLFRGYVFRAVDAQVGWAVTVCERRIPHKVDWLY
jgi:hypothetical protein